MIDHLSVQVRDVAASAAFYSAVLAPLGGERVLDFGDVIGFGVAGRPSFWIGPTATGGDAREIHVAVAASDRGAGDAFHYAAGAAGAPLPRRRGRGGRRGAARAARVARIPPELLRRLRARPGRQQRGGRLPH